jgi:Domain of unknown function (DUF929)
VDVTTSKRWMARSVLAVMLCGIVCAAAAPAASAATPRRSLTSAFGHVLAIAKHSKGSTKQEAVRTATDLAVASFPELWSSPREVVAPSLGSEVFTNSAAALRGIVRLRQSGVSGLGPTAAQIVVADRAVAALAITQAGGAGKSLLASARHQLIAGDRAAGAASVSHYEAAWKQAFKALDQLVSARVTHVPTAALTAAATNALGSKQIALQGPEILTNQPPLAQGGKPELLYIGAEGCPFCGIQRWGLIVALSQFGKFSNLHLMQSLTTEKPLVRTFTFFASHYSSPYVSFVAVEWYSNFPTTSGPALLQPPTQAQQQLFETFNQPQIFPFVDIANGFANVGSTARPTLVGGMSWMQIASSLPHPNSIAGQTIGGEAEVLTAELCAATNGQPVSVCSRPIVKQYQTALPSLDGKGGGCQAIPTAVRRRGQGPQATASRCHV